MGEVAGAVPRERGIVGTVALGSMLVPLNSTMIAVALPEVMRDLDADLGQAGWLVTGYLIAMAALQPVTGKLGDRLGRRRLLVWGLLGFGAASVGAAVSGSLAMLAFFRIGQACAGAIVMPNGSALLRQVVPSVRLGSRFGLVGSAIAFGAAAGPPVGGLLAAGGGWQWIFWVNVPLVVVALGLGNRALPRDVATRSGVRFDLVGAVLLTAILGAAAWTLKQWSASALVMAAGVATVAAAWVFVRLELRHSDPVLQPRLFRNRAFAASSGSVMLSNLAMYSVLVAVPLLFAGRGWTSAGTGLLLTALSAAMVVLAPLGGRLADRVGRRGPAVGGLGLLAAAMVVLAGAGSDVGAGALVLLLVVAGAGLGLSSPSIHTSALEAVQVSESGVAAGVYSTARYLGSIAGTSVLAGILAGPGSGFGVLFTIVAGAACVATVLAWALPRGREPDPDGGYARPMDAPAPRYDLSVDGGAGYHRDELADLATQEAAERAGDMADTLIPVPFESVLVDNDVPPGSTHVTFEASDGYAVSVPIAQATSNAILLVPPHDDPRSGVRLLLFGAGKACMNVKAVVRVSFSDGQGKHTVDPDPHRNRAVPGWDA